MPFVNERLEGVYWDYERSGHVPVAYSQLRRVVGAFAREGRWPHIKIGYSGNPLQRWTAYKRAGWSALIPIYVSTTVRNAHRMEILLIEYLKTESRVRAWIYNELPGGDGPVSESALFHYTYIALGRAYARLDYGYRE